MTKHAWVTHEAGWKLFSLVLAVAIWLTIHKIIAETGGLATPVVGDRRTYDELPVKIVSANADVHDYQADPATVAVTLSGPPDVIEVLQANRIQAVVNLTDMESTGELSWRVDVSTPPGVTVVSVEPPAVDLIAPASPPKKP